VALLEAMRADLDDENLADLYSFICDNVSEMKVMFGSPLILDLEAMVAHRAEQRKIAQEKPPAQDFEMRGDSVERTIQALKDAVATLPTRKLAVVK
jgi:hypothetical protein